MLGSILIGVALLSCICTAGSGAIDVQLSAKWDGTPYTYEAAELLSDLSPSLFWSYFEDRLASPSTSKETCWPRLIEQISRGLSKSEADVLQLSLSARQHSPRVEMYGQLLAESLALSGLGNDPAAPPSCCYADVSGQIITAPSALDAALEKATSTLDAGPGHRFPSSASATASTATALPTVVLYAPLGGDCTATWHAILKARAAAAALQYVLRPVLSDASCSADPCDALGTETPALLPGFGVEMVLKNMEYSARDDASPGATAALDASSSSALDASSNADAAETSLVDFYASLEGGHAQAGEAAASLQQLRRQVALTVDAGADSKLSESAVKDLGLQAAQAILASEDPLAILTEVAQQFPSLALALSQRPVTAAVRSSVEALQHVALSLGSRGALLINGVLFDHMRPTLEIHRLLPRLQAEVALAQQLKGLGLSDLDVVEVLKLRALAGADAKGGRFAKGGEGEAFASDEEEEEEEEEGEGMGGQESAFGTRLDIADLIGEDTPMPFGNDIEKDADYSQFPFNRLDDFLMPQLMYYPVKPVARNVLHAHSFLDPGSPSGLAIAATLSDLARGKYPVRFAFGLLPSVPLDPAAVWTDLPTSARVALCFTVLQQKFGGKTALKFLGQLAWMGQERGPDGVPADFFVKSAAGLDEERLEEEFTSAWRLGRRTAQGRQEVGELQAWKELTELQLSGLDEAFASLAQIRAVATAKGLAAGPAIVLLNGKSIGDLAGAEDMDTFFQLFSVAMESELRRILMDIYRGKLKERMLSPSNPAKLERTDVLRYVLSKSTLVPKLSSRVFDENGIGFDTAAAATAAAITDPRTAAVHPRALLSLEALTGGGGAAAAASGGGGEVDGDASAHSMTPPGAASPTVGAYQASLDPADLPAAIAHCTAAAPYLHAPNTEEEVKEVSLWLVADLKHHAGRAMVVEALGFLASSAAAAAAARVAVFDVSEPTLLGAFVNATLALPTRRVKIPAFLETLLIGPEQQALVERMAQAPVLGAPEVTAEALSLASTMGLNTRDLERLLITAPTSGSVAWSGCGPELATWLGIGLPTAEGGTLTCALVANGRVLLGCEEGSSSSSASPMGSFDRGDLLMASEYALRRQVAGHVAAIIRRAAVHAQPATQLDLNDDDESDVDTDPVEASDSDALLPVDSLSLLVARVASVLTARGALPIQSEGTALAASGFTAQLGARSRQLSGLLRTVQSSGNALVMDVGPPPELQGAGAPIVLEAILDPLSKDAQIIGPLLRILNRQLGFSVRLLLLPKAELSELPLKHYYRFAVPELSATQPFRPRVAFQDLPMSRVFTMGVDVPEPWLVEATRAAHDLDNLVLSEVGSAGMDVAFELEALLIQGSCVDPHARSQVQYNPRGLRLQLEHPAEGTMANTLVMSNLGYFQLQAAPGRFSLGLAPGRSRDLYFISGASDLHAPFKHNEAGAWVKSGRGLPIEAPVTVASFQGKWLHLRVAHRPGREGEDVLGSDEDEGAAATARRRISAKKPATDTAAAAAAAAPSSGGRGGGLLSRLGLGGGAKKEKLKETDAAASSKMIHIFTIASGAMYERLQRIMFLSVLRHTKSPVKFWIIKNYMSPDWKRWLPAMAAEHHFEYELVTYKWPTWLNAQHEKQRIIWAYKILFLDVLFPLELDKVIFVDSDQVIRTDMLDLMELDLQGAPLAYTPFCENNKEVEGYRFWKQGFWKNHLRGKPYHISALYVVDLKRFRKSAAGDNLRVLYDGLSRDRNSLSNLDQDLPNYAQHEVPIFSLPQEWLWCESWCGNATKSRARTIDLCNNPQSKEPKLAMARRIVAEWPELDEQQRRTIEKVQALEREKAGVASEAKGHGGRNSNSKDEL